MDIKEKDRYLEELKQQGWTISGDTEDPFRLALYAFLLSIPTLVVSILLLLVTIIRVIK